MDRSAFLRALDDMLELDPGTLTPETRLEDLEGWDSLAVISFIALVDEQCGHVVSGDALLKAATVADLLALAEAA
jgi:acyl carrier protein